MRAGVGLRLHLIGFADFSPCGSLRDCVAETFTSTSGASSAKPSCSKSKVSFLDVDANVTDVDAPANDNDAADVATPLCEGAGDVHLNGRWQAPL